MNTAQTSQSNPNYTCPRCQAMANNAAKFCQKCGWELSRPFLSYAIKPKHMVGLLVAAAALWGITTSIQKSKAGTKPTQAYMAEQHSPENLQKLELRGELQKLKEAANQSPNNLALQQQYSLALLEEMKAQPAANTALVFEAMDAFGAVLKLAADDLPSLLGLADIAFNQQVFDKALAYYEKFLRIDPNQLAVRGRYASSLTFVGRTDEAIKELNEILKLKPNDFHALAYLAITYAQIGNNQKALSLGQEALKFAPSPEAKKRFSDFLETVKSGQNKPTNNLAPHDQRLESLLAFIKQNKIAGPKFVQHSGPEDGELKLMFKDFPMQQMPDFAKNKFITGLKEKITALKLSEIQSLIFIDQDSGKILEKTTLSN